MGKKMGYTEMEVGHMTFIKFCSLHQAYKDIFDFEATLTFNRIRHSDLEKETTLDDVIPF